MFVGAIPKAEGICGDDQPCLFLASYSPNKIELKGGLPRRLVSEQKGTAVFTQGRFSEQLYQNSSTLTLVEHCSQCSETQRFWDSPHPTLYLEIGKQWSLMLLRSSSSASKHSPCCAAAWSRCFRRESSCACSTNVRLRRFVGRYSVKKLLGYSAGLASEPPNSSRKSFSFGKPSFIRSNVS